MNSLKNLGQILCFLIITLLGVVACGGGSSGGSSGATPISYTLANGTIVSSPTNAISVTQGGVATTTVSISGGTSGVPLNLSSSVSGNSESSTHNIIVTFYPESLVTGDPALSNSLVVVDASNALPGSYTIQLFVGFVVESSSVASKETINTTSSVANIGNITFTVNPSPTPVAGNLVFTPSSTIITGHTAINLSLKLSGSALVNNLPVSITSRIHQ